MSDVICSAVISGGIALLGTIITVLATSRKTTSEINTRIALLDERVRSQKESIDRHNGFGIRIPVIEEQLKTVTRRVDGLEKNIKQ